jgi:plastocyanin
VVIDTSDMTAADKFGIAFSIGFTVALIAFAMSFSAMSSAPTESIEPTTLPPVEEPAPPVEEEIPEEEVVEEEVEEEAMEETPEEEVVEEEVVEEEHEVAMSADVSVPSGSATPGCEETDECFLPSTVEIGVGGTVTWTNDDTAAHTVTSGTVDSGPDGTFDSSIFMAGKTFEHTFDEAGEYDYFCVVHPWMTGKVIVE